MIGRVSEKHGGALAVVDYPVFVLYLQVYPLLTSFINV